MIFFFSSRRRHTRYWRDWSSDVCSSDLVDILEALPPTGPGEQWGYTGIFSKQNGGGLLTAVYPQAHKAIWRSEERRVGKEGRSRWSSYHLKKTNFSRCVTTSTPPTNHSL